MKNKIKRLVIGAVVSLLAVSTGSNADEGMWTFQNPPLKEWKEKYNFEPTAQWLQQARLSAVHIGASAGFVSSDGLLATNQHVANDTLSKISSKEKDYSKDGFLARTRQEEIKSPDLEVSVLVSYEDVTKRVHAAVGAQANDTVAAEKRKAVIAQIEKEATDQTGLKCSVVSLYNGGEYWLYRQKKYTDVRLVFAAEEQMGFFGGDYDNFTYPRYNLDVAFFRAYEDGKPAHTPNHFKWSATGPKDGEFVIALGSPGSTARLLTVAQLAYQRDISNPLQKQVWSSQLSVLEKYAATGAEEGRQADSQIRTLRNSLKRLVGQQDGLMNPRLYENKVAEEKELLTLARKNPGFGRDIDVAINKIAEAQKRLSPNANRLMYSNLSGSRFASLASQLVRYNDELKKPNEQRYEEFRDSRLESLKFQLLSEAPIYPRLEEAVMTAWLEEGQKALGPNDPFMKAALDGNTPADLVKAAVAGTKLADVAFRKMLLEGGVEGIAQSKDSMIVLARRVEPVIRELRAWQEDNVSNVIQRAAETIAKARFAIYKHTKAPDANSSLRISYGRVKGYEQGTTLVPHNTTYYGLFDRAASFKEAAPFDLSPRWKTASKKLELSTPFNFVYTADTIGGNSGSPVVNRNGELVGLNFDSNLQKLSNKYWYVSEEEGARAVAVHSAGILEALNKIYQATELVTELTTY